MLLINYFFLWQPRTNETCAWGKTDLKFSWLALAEKTRFLSAVAWSYLVQPLLNHWFLKSFFIAQVRNQSDFKKQ